MEMKKSFETNMMKVMIESVSYTGSAFGSNEDGDTVFFNQRLVEKVALEMGDIVEAFAIPNYEDKRAATKRHPTGRAPTLQMQWTQTQKPWATLACACSTSR